MRLTDRLSLAFGGSELIRFQVVVGRVAAAAGFLPVFLRFAMVRVCAVVRSALMLWSKLS